MCICCSNVPSFYLYVSHGGWMNRHKCRAKWSNVITLLRQKKTNWKGEAYQNKESFMLSTTWRACGNAVMIRALKEKKGKLSYAQLIATEQATHPNATPTCTKFPECAGTHPWRLWIWGKSRKSCDGAKQTVAPAIADEAVLIRHPPANLWLLCLRLITIIIITSCRIPYCII